MTEMAVITPFGFSFEVVRFLSAWKALGCTRAQFYRNEQKPPTVAEALAAAAKAGIRFDSMHGVFGEHIDPSSPDADHRAKCLTTYEAEGKLASDLGGPMVVVHPSCWNPGRKEMTPEQIEVTSGPRWPLLDDFLRRLAEIGERLGVVSRREGP
jgi:sugar phosphate isomerase/epimerase